MFIKKYTEIFSNRSLIDYGIQIKRDIKINKNYITFNDPLALIYVLGFLISRDVKKYILLDLMDI